MDLPSISRSGLPLNAGAPDATQREQQLQEAARAFESIFLQQMMKAGRNTELGDDLFGSSAVDTTRDLLDEAVTNSVTNGPGLGIAEAVYDQFAPHVLGRGYKR